MPLQPVNAAKVPSSTLTCIQDSLGQDGTKLGHNVVMLIVDHLCVKLPELVHLNGEGNENV